MKGLKAPPNCIKGVIMKERVLKNITRVILIIVILYCIFILYNTKIKSVQEQNKEISRIESEIYKTRLKEDNLREKMKEKEGNNDKSSADLSTVELNPVGILYIPKINSKMAIYGSTEENAIRNGVGILETTGSLREKKGQNTILTTHNGDDKKDLFMNLGKLKVNDRFYTKDLNDNILEYKVYNISKVLPTEIFSSLEYDKDKSRITLMTCTPMGINSHRLMVSANLIKRIEKRQELAEFNELTTSNKLVFSNYEIVIILILLISIVLFAVSFKGGNNKEQEDEDYEIDIYGGFENF